jgi:ammonium transporter Rh
MYVHTFGAFFGVGATLVLTDKEELRKLRESKFANLMGSSYTSDLFAMVGTVFLWIYWPSFNGAFATGASRQRVVVNTVLGLCSSCTTAFMCSYLLRRTGRFSMVDIQNATLAGGVAIGAASDLVTNPWAAMLVGMVGGGCSVFGYVFLQDWLEEKIGLHDTCGVLNLHGIPGVIGGIAGAVSAANAGTSVYGQAISDIFPAMAPDGDNRSASQQGGYQTAALFTTIGIAVSGGALSAFIVRLCSQWLRPPTNERIYRDNYYWEAEEEEEFGYQMSFDMREMPQMHGGRRVSVCNSLPAEAATNGEMEAKSNSYAEGELQSSAK